jgi:hypothetical protein
MPERLRRLSKAELVVFRRRYGIRECDRKGACASANTASRRGSSKSLRKRWRRAGRYGSACVTEPASEQHAPTRRQCAASRQPAPPVPCVAGELQPDRVGGRVSQTGQVRRVGESKRLRVDTIPQPRGRRAIVEDVAQVSVAAAAQPWHSTRLASEFHSKPRRRHHPFSEHPQRISAVMHPPIRDQEPGSSRRHR